MVWSQGTSIRARERGTPSLTYLSRAVHEIILSMGIPSCAEGPPRFAEPAPFSVVPLGSFVPLMFAHLTLSAVGRWVNTRCNSVTSRSPDKGAWNDWDVYLLRPGRTGGGTRRAGCMHQKL